MKILRCLLLGFNCIALLIGVTAYAENKPGLSDQQKKEVGPVVHQYLLKNPEILVQVGQELQKKQMAAAEASAQTAIKADAEDIFNSKTSPVVGNPKGKVTLVEFFDYNCIHCQAMYSTVDKLKAANPNLRIVFKEFPILGPGSLYAAKIALASGSDYYKMHEALFKADKVEGKMTDEVVNKIAESLKVNAKSLADNKALMQKADDEIKANYQLATKLGIQGTPAFIIAPTPSIGNKDGKVSFIPGRSSQEDLQEAIDAAK